jgi:formylglycine-generating enzyme required for sulfatase activity
VLARFGDAELLSTLLLESDAAEFSLLLPGTSHHRTEIIESMRRHIAGHRATVNDSRRVAKQVRNAAITLLRLQQAKEIESLMTVLGDPTIRTMLILEMRDFGVPLETLLDTFTQWRDPVARQGIVLAMGSYIGSDLPDGEETALHALVGELLQHGVQQAERSAAEWLAARLDRTNMPDSNRPVPLTADARSQRDWWTTQQGHTMLIVPAPIARSAQAEASPSGRLQGLVAWPTIERDFAVSVHEVTISQFRRFRPDADFALDVADSEQCPANKVSYFDAIRYCQWLSEQEGIAEQEMCYGPDIEATPPALARERLERTGYRLPTEAEWEYICGAGSTTPWFCGDNESHLEAFAWFELHARGRQGPVGSLRPNPYGLFDIAGNAAEWCHSTVNDGQYVLRGGAYNSPASTLRSRERYTQSARAYSFTGFRIARTIRSNP